MTKVVGEPPTAALKQPNQTTAQRLASAWLLATQALGYALTTREMAALWATHGEGPPPRPLSNTAQNLAKNGTLVCVVDRPGRRRYAHRDHPGVTAEPPVTEHFEAGVLAALHDAAVAHQRYVTTREVTAAMIAGGYVSDLSKDDKTRLAWTLSHLSNPVRQRVAPFAEVPGPVVRAETRRFSGHDDGRTRVRWWRPAQLDLPPPHPDTPGTPREAATRAVETVRAALGRPATTEEVALWLAARRSTHPADPVVLALGDERGLGPAIAAARGWLDRSTAKGQAGEIDWGLAPVRTPFTAGRLLPPRVALGPVTPEEMSRAVATDLLLRLRPGREVETLDWLAAQPAAREPALQDLVALRRALLLREFAAHVPPDQWPDVLAHLRHALETLEGWLGALQGTERWSGLPRRFRRILGPREQDILALTQLLADARVPTTPARFADLEPLTVIGQGASLSMQALAPFNAGLVAIVGPLSSGVSVHTAFRRARRVPPPVGATTTRATPLAVAVAAEHLDRVDALAVAVDHSGLPNAGILVGDAVSLLGGVLRDVRVVERLLDATPRRHGWAYGGLLVAQGLLGEAPDPARWMDSADDAPAGVLATALADPDRAGAAIRRVLATEGNLRGDVRQVLVRGITQIEAGEWLGAVE